MAGTQLAVHRCRFLELKPSTIVALAFRDDGAVLAVGRENGDIEMWDVRHNYVCQAVRVGCPVCV
jgi:hypothetical protein